MVLYFSVKINLVSYRIPTNFPKKNKVSTNNRFQPAWNPNVKIIQNLFNPAFLRKRGRDQFGSYPTWAFPWIISTIYRLNKWCIIESNENHYSSSAPARLEVGRSLLIPATAPHLSFRIAFFFLCRGDRYCLIQSMIPFPCRKLPPMSKVPIRYPITNANCIYAPIILLPTSPYFSNTFLSSFIRNTEHLTEISWRTRRKKQETRGKKKQRKNGDTVGTTSPIATKNYIVRDLPIHQFHEEHAQRPFFFFAVVKDAWRTRLAKTPFLHF